MDSWSLLEQEPQVGDVLMYDNCAMIVLVLRRYFTVEDNLEVNVLWLLAEELHADISTHCGGFSSWKGWHKL